MRIRQAILLHLLVVSSGLLCTMAHAQGGLSPIHPVKPTASILMKVGPSPTNVTVTAISATSTKVEWTTAAGALRYVISRNGAEDTLVEMSPTGIQPNRLSYTDNHRRPATLYMYTVTAQFNSPLLPGRSTPVEILMPPLLPPQNFNAMVTGPSVTLTWTARPEAVGYRIIRNGGKTPTVNFRVDATSYKDESLQPDEYTYTIVSVIESPIGMELQGEYSSPIIIKTRPFNIVAVGDSIMWGQGLRPENKFAAKVRDWLQVSLGKQVNLYLV